MSTVKVFLRTPLFVPRGGKHVPSGAMVLSGQRIDDSPSGGWLVAVTEWADASGKSLKGPSVSVFVPHSKIDHAIVAD